jgi:hypothetical protein
MHRLVAIAASIVALAVLAAPGIAASPGTTGQPSQECLSATAPLEPGRAASAPGSAFNEPTDTSPGGVAGKVYAGSGRSTQTPANAAAVSQYDVACFQVSQSRPR